jgi:hypothetical protein
MSSVDDKIAKEDLRLFLKSKNMLIEGVSLDEELFKALWAYDFVAIGVTPSLYLGEYIASNMEIARGWTNDIYLGVDRRIQPVINCSSMVHRQIAVSRIDISLNPEKEGRVYKKIIDAAKEHGLNVHAVEPEVVDWQKFKHYQFKGDRNIVRQLEANIENAGANGLFIGDAYECCRLADEMAGDAVAVLAIDDMLMPGLKAEELGMKGEGELKARTLLGDSKTDSMMRYYSNLFCLRPDVMVYRA